MSGPKGPEPQRSGTSRLAIGSLGLALVSLIAFLGATVLGAYPALYRWLHQLHHLIPSMALALMALTFLASFAAALALAIIAIGEIRKVKRRGMTFAMASILVLGAIVAGVVSVALAMCHRMRCETNLSGLGKAIQIYTYDSDGKYPTRSKWCDLLIEHADVTEKSFVCRAAEKGRGHYAINPDCGPNSPPDVVLLFETRSGWNQYGGPESLTLNHRWPKGCLILFNCDQVEYITRRQVEELKWSRDVTGPRPWIHHVIWEKDLEKLQAILGENAQLAHERNIFGWSPLQTAVLAGTKGIVKLLLSKGVGDNVDNTGCTPMHAAASKGDAEIAALLLEAGLEADRKDRTQRTPLHEAAWRGHKEVASLLIAHGARVNATDNMGSTPLEYALRNDQHELAELLRKHGGVE